MFLIQPMTTELSQTFKLLTFDSVKLPLQVSATCFSICCLTNPVTMSPEIIKKCYFVELELTQGLLEFIWTEGYSGRSANPGLSLAILVLWYK